MGHVHLRGVVISVWLQFAFLHVSNLQGRFPGKVPGKYPTNGNWPKLQVSLETTQRGGPGLE